MTPQSRTMQKIKKEILEHATAHNISPKEAFYSMRRERDGTMEYFLEETYRVEGRPSGDWLVAQILALIQK